MSRGLEPVQLGTIALFCKAAELSSFTAAALSNVSSDIFAPFDS